jgi:serpin B
LASSAPQRDGTTPPEPRERPATAALDYARMNNAFALRLYGVVSGEAGNVFFSPLSISTAMIMAYAGANGKTAREMEQALSLTLSGDALHATVHETLSPILGSVGELRLANRLWPQQGLELEKPFLALMTEYYRAPVEQLDFRAAAEPSRLRINAWVGETTKQKIPELLAKGTIDASTAMVLTNAIYFMGVWQQQFRPESTKIEPFTTAAGAVVQTPLMHQTLKARYGETPDAQVVELPYYGSTHGPKLAMDVILPKDAGGLAAVEKSLVSAGLAAYVGALLPTEVDVSLPRFKTSWRRGLNSALQALGMREAFGASADFSAMARGGGLFISLVQHEAFVDVSERGTEAAAATGVVMRKTAAARRAVFRADRPFVFVLRDIDSGLVLFMGRLSKPA